MCLDFDVLIVWIPLLLPQLYVFTHRGVTHSIFIAFLVSTVALYIFTRKIIIENINARLKAGLSAGAKLSNQTVLAAYLGALSHILLDYSTTYGVPVFYPLSINKYSGELFFYMDFILMISGIALVLALYKKKIRKSKPFLAAFLLLILAIGGFRLVEKSDVTSVESSQASLLPPPSLYPTANPFVWWVVKEDREGSSIYVKRYDALLKNYDFSEIYPKLEVAAGNSSISFDEALASANDLPQVERFYWNAAKVSTTAIYNSTADSWLIQLKDPLRDAMRKSSPGFSGLNPRERGGLNISVSKDEARALY